MTDPALSDLGLCPLSSLRTFSFVALSPGELNRHISPHLFCSLISVSLQILSAILEHSSCAYLPDKYFIFSADSIQGFSLPGSLLDFSPKSPPHLLKFGSGSLSLCSQLLAHTLLQDSKLAEGKKFVLITGSPDCSISNIQFLIK